MLELYSIMSEELKKQCVVAAAGWQRDVVTLE